jgi:L-asparaginase II
MTAVPGRLVAKAGAEAVQGIADRARGLGLFLKIRDGNARAASPAVLEGLRQAGWIESPELDGFADLRRPVLRNHAGLVVGRIEADFVLETTGNR